MRRKSERTASKKTKSSPEKKVEKVKRTRGRRRKQSSSSNESAEEIASVTEVELVPEVEKSSPQKPAKEDSPEDTQDQVWQVKTAESSGDKGEIKKLKICLTRPPSTPERAERSPRSKRKHSRATSSSDTPSVEGVEEKKKPKHRSKRSSKESDKNNDSLGEDADNETESHPNEQTTNDNTIQSAEAEEKVSQETPMSTTNEDTENDTKKESESAPSEVVEVKVSDDKTSDADTTVASPKPDNNDTQSELESTDQDIVVVVETLEPLESSKLDQTDASIGDSQKPFQATCNEDVEMAEVPKEPSPIPEVTQAADESSQEKEVSKVNTEDVVDSQVCKEAESTQNDNIKTSNENDVVVSSDNIEKDHERKMSTDSNKDKEMEDTVELCHNEQDESMEGNDSRDVPKVIDSDTNQNVESDKHSDTAENCSPKELDKTETTKSDQEQSIPNGQSEPIVINRKRRWGSRPSKVTKQKSITISTDVLKDIIPDVKPVEFEEVIEERKQHKRIDNVEKIERPVLPKIVIDNTENVEHYKKEREESEKEHSKSKDSHLASNRKISIVKENDSIIARPPSPPKHKQSNILYITNLVRPFTLPQLKNLLQRTGRIMENGFWIDKIKSKCFVKYETEDQAIETRHALHGVTWPVSNPKTLQVDFSTQDAFDKAKLNEDADNAQTSTIPGTVEDWLREQDAKRDSPAFLEKPWERKGATREWDVGKNEKDKDKLRKDEKPLEKRRHRTPERSPEPARKFKKKEEEAPAKLLDDLFRKTKATPCIYWLPLSAETIAIKEEQRRQHMAEHKRRLQQELRRTHRRH